MALEMRRSGSCGDGISCKPSRWERLPVSCAKAIVNAMERISPTSPAELREKLVECLGGTWPEPCPLRPLLRETRQQAGYRIESITYEAEPHDRVPAMLLVPDGVSANSPAPAVAVWHQHTGQYELGKSEPAGLAGDPLHHTGAALAREGYVVLCPDTLCFEEPGSQRQTKGAHSTNVLSFFAMWSKARAWPGRTFSTCGGPSIT